MLNYYRDVTGIGPHGHMTANIIIIWSLTGIQI